MPPIRSIARDLALVAAGSLFGSGPDPQRKDVAKYQPKDTKTVVWHMRNLEDGSEIEGQFPAEDPVLNLTTAYGEHVSLNRQNPIIQFLHGTSDTFSFTARFFALHGEDNMPDKQLKVLQAWRVRDPTLARPPRVAFTLGNIVPFPEAVITSLGNIAFTEPLQNGNIREVALRVDLLRYTKYSLETSPEPETRYYAASTGDYFEMLAWKEYRNPMLGVLLRRSHPELQVLTEGDIVRLPSYGAMKGKVVKPDSIVMSKAFGTKDTATRRLRQEEFALHDRSYISGIVPEGL
jgi:hypothetical protein